MRRGEGKLHTEDVPEAVGQEEDGVHGHFLRMPRSICQGQRSRNYVRTPVSVEDVVRG